MRAYLVVFGDRDKFEMSAMGMALVQRTEQSRRSIQVPGMADVLRYPGGGN